MKSLQTRDWSLPHIIKMVPIYDSQLSAPVVCTETDVGGESLFDVIMSLFAEEKTHILGEDKKISSQEVVKVIGQRWEEVEGWLMECGFVGTAISGNHTTVSAILAKFVLGMDDVTITVKVMDFTDAEQALQYAGSANLVHENVNKLTKAEKYALAFNYYKDGIDTPSGMRRKMICSHAQSIYYLCAAVAVIDWQFKTADIIGGKKDIGGNEVTVKGLESKTLQSIVRGKDYSNATERCTALSEAIAGGTTTTPAISVKDIKSQSEKALNPDDRAILLLLADKDYDGLVVHIRQRNEHWLNQYAREATEEVEEAQQVAEEAPKRKTTPRKRKASK